MSNYQKAFQKILELVGFDDPDEKFYYELPSDEGENNLMNPCSKATCLCLWLWTIEPSFYSWVNQAAQEKDLQNLQFLGPFARSISMILSATEEERVDSIQAGDDVLSYDPKNALGTFNSSFLLFRFANMEPAELKKWKECVGKKGLKTINDNVYECNNCFDTERDNEDGVIRNKDHVKPDYHLDIKQGNENKPSFVQMQGTLTAYRSYQTAFRLGNNSNPNFNQVLFVICMHNYGPFAGFRLNNENYSAHPHEQQVVIMDGAPMFVVGTEEITIDWKMKSDAAEKQLKNRRRNEPKDIWMDQNVQFLTELVETDITVIYLFNASDYQDHLDDLIQKGIKQMKQRDTWKPAMAKKVKIKSKRSNKPKQPTVEDIEELTEEKKERRNMTSPELQREQLLSPAKGKEPVSGSSGRETAAGSGETVPEGL